MSSYTLLTFFLFLLIFITPNRLDGQNWDKINSANYIKYVVSYADAMIEHGQDNYGTEHSPLFASALNRKTFNLGSKEEFGTIPGVRETDRSVGGANPLVDLELYKILYRLTDLTRDKVYAGEADKALTFFFTHCQSPNTGLMCWGEHLYWDFYNETCGHAPNFDFHEADEWSLWDKSYELAPEACWNFAIGEWDNQIADKTSGDFSRHAQWSVHGPKEGMDFPRYAGQMIERWADAYIRKDNYGRERRDELITAISVIIRRMEENMKTHSGFLLAYRGADYVWPASNLELARCLMESAPKLKNELAVRMKKLAIQQDINFLKSPHCLDSIGGGFAVTLNSETGKPRSRSMNKPYTATWDAGYGYETHASIANLCYRRYCQLILGYPEISSQYKKIILLAAERYLTSIPDSSLLLKPISFAQVIELMLNSYEMTKDLKYLGKADYFGKLGVDLFFDSNSPLPRASNKNIHYESITGGPKFINSLLDLHLALNKIKK